MISGCQDLALSTKSSNSGSLFSDRPALLPGIRQVEASEAGGITLTSEGLGSRTGVLDGACVEEMGISKETCGFVPGGARNFFQH